MTTTPTVKNNTVYARVRTPSRMLRPHVESAFSSRSWHFEYIGSDDVDYYSSGTSGEYRTYIVAIPLYCAAPVAVTQARAALYNFSRQEAPLVVDEVRLITPERDRRKGMGAKRTRGGILNLLPRRLSESRDATIRPLNWEVSLDRSDASDVQIRRDEERREAHRRFKTSKLPGEPFNPETMDVSSPSEPKEPIGASGDWSWRSLTRSILATALVVAAIGTSTYVYLDIHPIWRSLSALASITLVTTTILWATGDRLEAGFRFLSAASAIPIVAFVGFSVSLQIENHSESPTFIISTVSVALLVIFLSSGWRHLAIIHPGSRKIWSFTSLTAIGAISTTLSQLLLAAWSSELGLPAEEVAIPLWLRFTAGAMFIVYIGSLLYTLGGLFGWSAYFGLSAGSLINVSISRFAACSLALVMALTGSTLVIDRSEDQVDSWIQSLNNGTTPDFTSGFLYRACIQPTSDSLEYSIDIDSPQIVAQGKSQTIWVLTSPSEEGFRANAQAIHPDKAIAHRVPDGTDAC